MSKTFQLPHIEMLKWDQTSWMPIRTQDGSYSLRMRALRDGQSNELMHHSAGALGESHYVYGRVVRLALDRCPNLILASVGFGLGYNELVAFAQAKVAGGNLCIWSFEKDLQLYSFFFSSLERFLNQKDFWQRNQPMDYVLDLYFSIFQHFPQVVLQEAWAALHFNRWRWAGPLGPTLPDLGEIRFHLFFWDAFSEKTDRLIWDPTILQSFVRKYGHPQTCWFTTYACHRRLKDQLRNEGFQIYREKGYHSKRHHVWAYRGVNHFTASRV